MKSPMSIVLNTDIQGFTAETQASIASWACVLQANYLCASVCWLVNRDDYNSIYTCDCPETEMSRCLRQSLTCF